MDVSDTPISPVSIDDDFTPLLLSDSVMQEYKKLITLINNPETAKEYSFVLLGKSASFTSEKCYFVDRIVDCNSSIDNLSSRETKMDGKNLMMQLILVELTVMIFIVYVILIQLFQI